MSDSKSLAIIPRTIGDVSDLSGRFAKSALIPNDLRGKEADVFVTILAGQELGFSPMASLRSIHVVKGKPVLSADAMVGLVLGSGVCDYFEPRNKTATSVTYETQRKGGKPTSLTWTMQDAEAAGLKSNDMYRKYPRQMLSARCKAELARDVYPDVLAGVCEESEVHDVADRSAPDAEDAEVVAETPEPAFDIEGVIARLSAAADETELRAIAAEVAPLSQKRPDVERARIKAAYAARAAVLRQKPAAELPEQTEPAGE